MAIQEKEKRKRKGGIFTKIKKWFGKIATLDVVLIFVGSFFFWFNYQMLEMFKAVGSIPEGYACAVVAATIGECGICGWIRTNKDKKQQRVWDKEDQKESNSNN